MSGKEQHSRNIDRTTTLCLACSSSLPPLKSNHSFSYGTLSSSGTKLDQNSLYITKCCQRVICPSCITSNPRLARYNPCLACLGGVSAVASRAGPSSLPGHKSKSPQSEREARNLPDRAYNVDGAIRDEDTFVLGDDEDDEDGAEQSLDVDATLPPPPYDEATGDGITSLDEETTIASEIIFDSEQEDGTVPTGQLLTSMPDATLPETFEGPDCAIPKAPHKYYLSKSDTLLGISLRFGVDSREICKLNNLPATTIRTTPHLLHTRTFILLPPSAKASKHTSSPQPQSPNSASTDEAARRKREESLVRERAEKRLQMLTKEVDWRVAKAYVAISDDADEREAHNSKLKEMGPSKLSSQRPLGGDDDKTARELEIMAIERYLDDDEWEAEERRAGRLPEARPFPLRSPGATSSGKAGAGGKRRW